MKKILVLLFMCFSSLFANDDFIYEKSKYNFNELIKRVEQELKDRNLTIFAKFNHYQNALDVNLTLKSNTVIVFGNPIVGTYLMQENPMIGIELPLKILIWQDQNNETFIGYVSLKSKIQKYHIKNTVLVDKIDSLMKDIINITKK
ncbi:DUF302 domain-containing protein [Campylobacter jejuni]|uniref:DUF302 domain-containing protein n=2 Tax=Campylobacter jejuni TaxID=197 RepID=A0A697GQH5_CAMJU|nr:DUF302 domain-containing protein [Campylobacter jejuni]EAH5690395.1 DUF302 domain-containing protein [Campylobacter jejuni]EAK7837212.1 DUF302 domain-containing protein [Campylobacter jejuni]EAL0659931.1 DUF302 domain-containing protein [Campylobacter jejuni]EAL5851680.1 DUF302 domain-containing protein [Campylobacter jejuni]ECK7533672.1 DUF302 domain-containing protein [Campylobacter jejuni]